jgi:hypothetical protein
MSWLAPTGAVAAQARPAPPAVEDQSARDTRQRLDEILGQYPPSVAQVLRLDPSLLTKADYLAPYPALTAFLSQHPEIVRSPAFFLGEARIREAEARSTRSFNLLEEVLGGLAFLTAFTTLLFSLGWLVRTALADRRWQRLTKIQTEAHTKLLDKLSSHEELLAYIESPSGRKFLEAAPAPIDAGGRAVHAPIGRILWSAQAGIILLAVGLGLQFAKNRVIEELGQPLYIVGIVSVALGLGFAVSALAAYMLSERLGLLAPPKAHDA